MKTARAIAILLRALAHALRGWLTIRLMFGRLSDEQRGLRVQIWARQMLAILGIELQLSGQPPAHGPVLLVANHISWLDILPLIGTLATGAGTLYIERASRRDAMRVVHHMAARLAEGDILAAFPEGTTSDGVSLLPFHGNLLQAAVSAGAPVQPIALSFVDAHTRQTSLAPCYIGDDTLMGSIWRTLTTPGIVAVVNYGEPQPAAGRERRAWAVSLREEVLRLRG
jgi:1-acyl-sn-glycerol-3-phosphate acyltransferase